MEDPHAAEEETKPGFNQEFLLIPKLIEMWDTEAGTRALDGYRPGGGFMGLKQYRDCLKDHGATIAWEDPTPKAEVIPMHE